MTLADEATFGKAASLHQRRHSRADLAIVCQASLLYPQLMPPAPAESTYRYSPLLFVLLWSTGWVSAKFATGGADALTFLSWRFAFAGLLLALWAFAARVRWPQSRRDWLHALVSGALLHGLYLGGLWWAMRAGVSATISGLIAALQPILTAALAPLLLGESVSALQRLGIAMGFAGLALVLGPKLLDPQSAATGAPLWPVIVNSLGMLCATLGTFYQKRFLPAGDLRSMVAVQYAGAVAVVLPLALLFEPMHVTWSPPIVAIMVWSVLGLSIGGIFLILLMIRRGALARMAAWIYLVPLVVAVEAYFLFGDRLAPLQMGGFLLTVLGVVLATQK